MLYGVCLVIRNFFSRILLGVFFFSLPLLEHNCSGLRELKQERSVIFKGGETFFFLFSFRENKNRVLCVYTRPKRARHQLTPPTIFTSTFFLFEAP